MVTESVSNHQRAQAPQSHSHSRRAFQEVVCARPHAERFIASLVSLRDVLQATAGPFPLPVRMRLEQSHSSYMRKSGPKPIFDSTICAVPAPPCSNVRTSRGEISAFTRILFIVNFITSCAHAVAVRVCICVCGLTQPVARSSPVRCQRESPDAFRPTLGFPAQSVS